MKTKTKNKKNNMIFNNIKVIVGIVMLLTISTSIIVVSLRKEKVEPVIMTQDDTPFEEEDNDEASINSEYLPLIRVSYYDEETGDRSGYVITNNGTIYKYAFNDYTVTYPDSDVFTVNQTIYLENFVEEIGEVNETDLNNLIMYSETIDNSYDTEDMVFDTVGNSISVTNYYKEDIYVLINNEGIINKNENTSDILSILDKYNLGL